MSTFCRTKTADTSYIHAWVMQLHREHEKICWHYNVNLTAPVIEISESTSFWGSWSSSNSTIAVSRKLIELHSWEIVINVFKHEIAHQIVSEIFFSTEKHGDKFRKACDMVGVPEDFRRASSDLPRSIPDLKTRSLAGTEDKIITKVEKLLSLAQSTNEHEAQLAMEKANSYIARFNLDQIQSAEKSTYDYFIINHKKKRIENYQRRICSILSNYFFVKVILSNLYDRESCCCHKTIEIFGTRENVLIAQYVYSFLISSLSTLWGQYRKIHASSGRKKGSYWLGILDGFSKKLAEQKKNRDIADPATEENTKNMKSLIAIRNQELDHYISQRYPRLSTRKTRSSRIHSKEYSDGKNDGMALTLNKGVFHEDGFLGSLLPAAN